MTAYNSCTVIELTLGQSSGGAFGPFRFDPLGR